MRVTSWLLPFVVSVACAPGSLSAPDRAALDAAEERLRASVRASDWATLSELYADSAALMPPGAPTVVGRNAILTRFGTAGTEINAFETSAWEVGGVGPLAYVRGTYLLTAAPFGSSQVTTETGRFVRVWRREGGAWRIVADIWNADAAR